MRPDNFNVQDLIDHISGTCKSLQEGISDLYPDMLDTDLTENDHEEIDGQIFCCDTCNWWCEICDQDEDGNCDSCSTMSDEDDDE